MSDDLAAQTIEFCSLLRRNYGFNIGPRETYEGLRAVELVGVNDRARVAAALRTVFCSRPEEIAPFALAFDAFFSSEVRGVPQPRHAQQPSLLAEIDARPSIAMQPEDESLAEAWQALLARYSATAAASEPPAIPSDGLDEALREASRLIARLHLGRSRRWKPQPRGERFDLRRTLRASLRTGGDLLEPHTLGHPLRNPRFVLLLDGSRSMSEYAPRMLRFAYALCRRSRRVNAFLFSTELRDVTRQLRGARPDARLDDLGPAFGGGTRIGASLSDFLRKHGALLNDQTFVIVVSDGLDVGEIPQLQRAMREIARRSAAIGWVNPHAGLPNYQPESRGMLAAWPYVTSFASFEKLDALTKLGRRVRVAVNA